MNGLGFAGLGVLNLAEVEVLVVLGGVEALGVLVDADDLEEAAVRVDAAGGLDFVAGQVVVADEVLAGLVHVDAVRQLLTAEQQRKGIAAVVRVVHLADFHGVVRQVVVHDKWQVVATAVETQHLAVVVQELLLGRDFAASQALFKELLHLAVPLGSNAHLRLSEVVDGSFSAFRLFVANALQSNETAGFEYLR